MKNNKSYLRASLLCLFILALDFSGLSWGATPPADHRWPRMISVFGANVIVYEPQILGWDKYEKLRFQSALVVESPAGSSPVYGMVEVSGSTRVNHETSSVLLTELHFEKAQFGEVTEERAKSLKKLIEEVVATRPPREIPLDYLFAQVEESQADAKGITLSFKPPPIFVSNKPALLLVFTGAPAFKPVAGTDLQFAINTNWDLFLLAKSGEYFLRNQANWFSTKNLEQGPWTAVGTLPNAFQELPKDDNWKEVRESIPGKPAAAVPLIYVSNQPAELIVISGKPELVPIAGTQVLYVKNTEADLFVALEDQYYYFVVAGRWFKTKDLEKGPWLPMPPDSATLPKAFAQIPKDHAKAHVLASIPGTPEAGAAVARVNLPKKAEVDRKSTTIQVAYDGEPKFELVKGSQTVEFAANSKFTVFRVKGQYHCLENGVWFAAVGPNGPWQVATAVPSEIYAIPPESPHHYVTYVKVYESTPDTVVVGYTSGYTGNYVVNGVVVFGAGYWYPPPAYAYPYWYYPVSYYSYGCYARYNYYSGGYVRGVNYYGPYGGAGYGTAYNPATGVYSRGAYAYGPSGGSAWARQGYNPSTGRSGSTVQGRTPYGSWGRSVVSDGNNWVKTGHSSGPNGTTAGFSTSQGAKGAIHQGDKGNTYVGKDKYGDLYVGRNGDVYKRSDNGWEQTRGNEPQPKRTSGNGDNVQARRDSQRPSTQEGIGNRDLDSSRTARQTGQYNYQQRNNYNQRSNYNQQRVRQQRSSPSRGRSHGGARGGGRRR